MKKSIKIEFELSQPAWDLLVSLAADDDVYAEYRDSEYQSLDDYKANRALQPTKQMIENFLKRNHGGTYHAIIELYKLSLVEPVENTWHVTYKISKLGKQVVKTNQ